MQVENYTSQAKSNAGTTQDKESGGERERGGESLQLHLKGKRISRN